MSDGERCAHCDHVRAAHVVLGVVGMNVRPLGCAVCESCYTFEPQRPLVWGSR